MFHNNLIKILQEKKHLKDIGITFIESSEKEYFLSYEELYSSSLQALSFLQYKGLQPKNELVFQIDDNKSFIIVFWACILGGIIPVPLTVGRNDDHRQKLFNVWKILNQPYLISFPENVEKLQTYAGLVNEEDTFRNIQKTALDINEIFSINKEGIVFNPDENDIAYVQFSSGSTGDPKGVVLTHKNLVTNINAITACSGFTNNDSELSWMPLTHDMGLIGFHICPLFFGLNHYLMPTNLFIRRPAIWLDKATQHRATITCSPNFGYAYLLKQYNATQEYNWDLSNVRLIFNGAEPISESICKEFLGAMSRFGLKNTSMYPVYGLAEASLAVSFSKMEDEVITIQLDRNKLSYGDTICETSISNNPASFVNVGKAINHCSIRITGADNKPAGENRIGNIQIKGDNVTSGYYNNPYATAKIITNDGWLDTGDLGFMHNKNLYVTGRAKDIIFINGQNYYPHDIERGLEIIEEIELGKVLVGGFTSDKTGKEEVLVFVLYKGKTEKFIDLHNNIKRYINQTFGFEPNLVIPVREIPKTTSGKVQRFKLISRYKDGEFDEVSTQIQTLINSRKISDEYSEYVDKTETEVLYVCKMVLENNNIGLSDNLFAVGGNSLNAALLSIKLEEKFSVDFSIENIFNCNTIKDIADKIKITPAKKVIDVIRHIDCQGNIALSAQQKRLFYHWELNKGSVAYNLPVVLEIFGEVDIDKIEKSFNTIIKDNEILRTAFFIHEGNPFQQILENIDFKIVKLSCDENTINSVLKQLVKPFNLNFPPLIRSAVIQSGNRQFLFIDAHHIIIDGTSYTLILNELFNIYTAKTYLVPTYQYKDYVAWQEQNNTSEKIIKSEKYWLNEFKEDVSFLEFPIDYSRPDFIDNQGEKLQFGVNKELFIKLKEFAQENNFTVQMVLLAAYYILLNKYTNQKDIIVGIPAATRTNKALMHMIGMFVNNLPVRMNINPESKTLAFIEEIKNKVIKSIDNQDYMYDSLLSGLNIAPVTNRNPLFDTMFVYQNMSMPVLSDGNTTWEHIYFEHGISRFDLTFELFDKKNSLDFFIEYSSQLFKKETIARISSHFISTINVIITYPENKISEINFLSEHEKLTLLYQYNKTGTKTTNKSICQLFRENSEKFPNNIAVTESNKKLTYKELNDKSDRLSTLLLEKGIGPNDLVGVMLGPSTDVILAILGTLKSGAAYVPIDVNYPENRKEYIITNSNINLLITSESLAEENLKLSRLKEVITIDTIDFNLISGKQTGISIGEKNLAYVIYTSGTTGNPKGVMIEHGNLVNYILWAAQNYIKEDKAGFPLYTSISFDLTITSIFVPLVTGNTIHVYNDENDIAISKIIEDNKVDVVKLTPSHLKIVREILKRKKTGIQNIKRFIVGGEALESGLAEDIYNLYNKKIEIFNEYGPTETTVGCMVHKYNPGHNKSLSVPIGKPAGNYSIFLLDEYLKPAPPGSIGEIYIGGKGVGRGYLNNETLTNDKFIANPYLTILDNQSEKLYKSGDIAKWIPDEISENNWILDFIGRKDSQVKIRGYRIELEEIENKLLQYSPIDNAVVTCNTSGPDNIRLIGYYTAPSEIITEDLNSFLKKELPEYMIPAFLVQIDKIPLTLNGKVDIKSLPAPQIHQGEHEYAAPTNDIETVFINAYKKVIKQDKIGITDNFFSIGGDSIKAVQIASHLFNDGISINVKDILTYQTIEQICKRAEISGSGSKYPQEIIEGEKTLTPIEYWFFNQNLTNQNFYNQSVLLDLNREVKTPLLQKAFNKLIEHHDGLRLNYNTGKHCFFYNNQYINTNFEIAELNGNEDEDRLINQYRDIKSSFNICDGLLIKAAIIKSKNGYGKLFISAHHLVIDGISWRILLEDLYNIYSALENEKPVKLPYKTCSLIDWANRLTEYSANDELKRQEKYWDEVKKTVFAIPVDFKTDDWSINNSAKTFGKLNAEKTEQLLKKVHEIYKTDVPVIINTALSRSLQEWLKSDEFVIEQEYHGRFFNEVDTSRTVGWFTAIYPVRFKFTGKTPGDQVKSVKEELRSVPDNGIGYGVIEYFKNKSTESEPCISEIRFNYLGQFDSELNNDLFSYSDKPTGPDSDLKNSLSAKIEINCMIVNGIFTLEIIYNATAFLTKTIESFKNAIMANIETIIDFLINEKDIHFTSSDFETVELDEDELNSLFE